MKKLSALTNRHDPQSELLWRDLFISDVVNRRFEGDELVELLATGLQKAHDEGLLAAADICKNVAENQADARRVATVLEYSFRSLAAKMHL